MPLRVFIADDHQIMRQGLVALLQGEPEVQVVGEAADGRQAVLQIRDLHPDVVIMDIAMPNLNGIDATRQILADLPNTRIIALSARGDRQTVRQAVDAGASAYLLKDEAASGDLINAIRSATRDEIYMGPQVARRLADTAPPAADGHPIRALTPREREVLQLLAEGKAMKEVAAMLHVSIKTIETHRRSMMEKLDLFSTAELTKYAIREGLTSVEL